MAIRPFAYVSTAWSNDSYDAEQQAINYSRVLYEAGYNPICPNLMYDTFMDDSVPAERKDHIDMTSDLLRRCRIVVFCGTKVDENVKNELALADRLHIASTTLDGIQQIQSAQDTLPNTGRAKATRKSHQ